MRFRPPPVGRGDAPESECRLTRGGPPPPIRGNLQEAGLEQPRRQGDLEARSRMPATLVDTTFGAIADVGSIPTVSTGTGIPTVGRSPLLAGGYVVSGVIRVRRGTPALPTRRPPTPCRRRPPSARTARPAPVRRGRRPGRRSRPARPSRRALGPGGGVPGRRAGRARGRRRGGAPCRSA